MTYFDEVLHLFVDDVSSKLNIDLSWTLQQSQKLLDTSMHFITQSNLQNNENLIIPLENF